MQKEMYFKLFINEITKLFKNRNSDCFAKVGSPGYHL